MSERVRIADVSPRDGLQNEPGLIPVADKVRLVELLTHTGVDEIEVSSFVSPRWVPQLADAAEVFAGVAGFKRPGLIYSALTPNEKGLAGAQAVNALAGTRLIDKVVVFTAASETFARRNTNASIAETIARFKPVIAGAHADGLATRAYISCVVACPYEGPIAVSAVVDVTLRLMEIGVQEIDLGDTIGAATKETTEAMLTGVFDALGNAAVERTALHLHDTFGRAADCIRTGLKIGVRSFDGSAGGLGGCPFASTPERRAPGNIATETLVHTVTDEGYSTTVNIARLREAAAFASALRNRARSG